MIKPSIEHKENTAANCVRIPTPKVYHKSEDLAQLELSLRITIIIMVLSILANMIMFIRIDQLQHKLSQQDQLTTIDPGSPLEQTNQTDLPVGDKEPLYETMPICSTTSTFKSWMSYEKITNTSSRQWKLQQIATTDEYGFRKVGEYYMVAMAKQYGPVGSKYIITFRGGQQMPVIIGDVKANTSCTHPDGSMFELIVVSDRMPSNVKRSGNYNSMIEGTITEIRVVQEDIE
jgi:hypothetical protein